MHRVIVYLLITIFCTFPCKCGKNDTCRNFRRRHILKMTCNNGGKLFLPEVVGFYGKDCSLCQGQSAQLLTHKYNCSWRKRCKIKLNKRRMVTGCYRNMNSMKVLRGPCIQNGTKIYDLITTKTLNGKNPVYYLPETTIIVRSHQNFPWNYRYLTNRPLHRLRFNIRMENIGRKIVLSVVHMDIHSATDKIYIIYNKLINIPNEKDLEIDIENISYFDIELNSTSFISNTARADGFVLCLKLMDKTSQNFNSACEDVIRNDQLQISMLKSSLKKCMKGKKRRRHCRRRNRTKRFTD
ncbi:uncharacterized protein LOC133192208 [Saccostrea echinata]|uniref:uncharacterized protein LOC133192208 n=1 Tax=Saccostrea echinata TaxID=191078 RepID=UPI002A81097A|nr:uncharacterized protein LOC133192208 [Saccostrea echinata]